MRIMRKMTMLRFIVAVGGGGSGVWSELGRVELVEVKGVGTVRCGAVKAAVRVAQKFVCFLVEN